MSSSFHQSIWELHPFSSSKPTKDEPSKSYFVGMFGTLIGLLPRGEGLPIRGFPIRLVSWICDIIIWDEDNDHFRNSE
ncbi:hypothetical protein HPP92_022793 [Vanilla planifolia]|uniref:Uncharacterized protein n=1 Tax=Vanilla planifolia TaxID=51239 RepID=A0A835PSX5_VANPL|nr:hypothetical protein HPP92_023094 [Vanilla planifolia]KAG0459665.1 hypothetical protein HPP92_022793 [Vanilla planifolia]